MKLSLWLQQLEFCNEWLPLFAFRLLTACQFKCYYSQIFLLYPSCIAEISSLHIIFAGDEAGNSNDSDWGMDCSTVLRVKTLHISSPILAAKSPFFYKVKINIFLCIGSLSSFSKLAG